MLGCCSDMKFRQRVAWLGVVMYISLTAFICYYMFEISNAFNEFAVDHNHNYHTKDDSGEAVTHGVMLRPFSHIFDLPKPLLITLVLLLYLQGFFMLIACTKQEPRMYVAYAWPWYVYNRLLCRSSSGKTTNIEQSPATSAGAGEKVIMTMPA